MQEKAYKLLAAQENISHNEAKALIDAGLVSARGAKIALAREMLGENTKFSVMKPAKLAIIYASCCYLRTKNFARQRLRNLKICA